MIFALRTVIDLSEQFHRVEFKPEVCSLPDGFPNHHKRVRLLLWHLCGSVMFTCLAVWWIKKWRGLLSILLDFGNVDVLLGHKGDISTLFRLSSQQRRSSPSLRSNQQAFIYPVFPKFRRGTSNKAMCHKNAQPWKAFIVNCCLRLRLQALICNWRKGLKEILVDGGSLSAISLALWHAQRGAGLMVLNVLLTIVLSDGG